MTASDLLPIRDFVAALLALSDVDAVVALLAAKGNGLTASGEKLIAMCETNGQADQLVQRLRNPKAARQYVRDIVRTFQPFDDILRDILPQPGRWKKVGKEKNGKLAKAHIFTTTAEIVAEQTARQEQAEAKREKNAKRAAERAAAARFVVTFEDAAAEIGIRRNCVRAYIQEGKLVAVRPDGKTKAVGVTRASVDAYKAHLAEIDHNHAAVAARKEQERNDTKQRKTVGLYFTTAGERITEAERMSAHEVEALFGYSSHIMVQKLANAGRFERVFADVAQHHAVGYLRSSVMAYAEKRAAETAAGGTYWTKDGRKIVGAQRISRAEAAAILHCGELTVAAYARNGELVRVYADPGHVAPCGYTRESVSKYAATHPHHIPAKRAVAVEDFHIEVLPPKPRAPGLRAARLEPADPDAIEEPQQPDPAKESGPQQPDARPKRKRPCLIFRLTAAQLATATATDPNGENAMIEETNIETTPQQQTAEAKPYKLSVAKSYTVHVGGVIRAICVSEDDRDEIVAALELYQRMKTSPGEIEAALKVYRAVRETMRVTETPADQPDATPDAQKV